MSQMLTLIPRHQFQTLVDTHGGDHYVKAFTTWKQFVSLLYAQISGKDSLRDIQNGLAAQSTKTYHLGLENGVKRSTLCDANAKRSYSIFEGLFYKLLDRCRSVTPKHKFRFKNPLYSIDATVIDLCLAMFSWAKFRRTKGAIKLHYHFDHSGHIPSFITLSDGKRHDITIAKQQFDIIPDSIYCMDRGYVDFEWFRRLHDKGAFFVTRAKDNFQYQVLGQQDLPKNKSVLADLIIEPTGYYTKKDYPYPLRLIRYWDPESGRVFEFLTNNFKLSSLTIAQIYQARWQIETFFKWIKQNLKIKTFLGTSKNAVLTQIWIAMCYYLLLAYIKYQTKYRQSLFYLHRLIRETLLDRASLIDLLNLNEARLPKIRDQELQLSLF